MQPHFNRKDFEAAQGQSVFDLESFFLTKDSLVFVNGSPVAPDTYTGAGTKILQFVNGGLNEYDQVIIIT